MNVYCNLWIHQYLSCISPLAMVQYISRPVLLAATVLLFNCINLTRDKRSGTGVQGTIVLKVAKQAQVNKDLEADGPGGTHKLREVCFRAMN